MNLIPTDFRTRGRAAKPVIATVVRELDATDLALLQDEKGSQAPPLKRLSERHHALARTLASGVSAGDAAIMCGYTPSRVSILQDDPAFRELLEFYREDMNAQYRDLHQRLSGLAADAAELLQDKLEADMGKDVGERDVSVTQLMELTKLGADRTGHGPQTSQTNVNINVDLAARLESARKRVQERTINGTETNSLAHTDTHTNPHSDVDSD